jgi:hypothetical protein
VDFDWADPKRRLIWEGYLDSSKLEHDPERGGVKDMVLRLDVYVGERDTYGVGFSDNVIFRKQYYIRAVFNGALQLFRHEGEQFMQKLKDATYVPPADDVMKKNGQEWEFRVAGTGFEATLGIELDWVPEDGPCVPLTTGDAGSADSAMPRPSSESAKPGA